MTLDIGMIEAFKNVVDALNQRFLHELCLDFEVVILQHEILKLKASTDFCYYHDCEIEFSGVRYFSGPMLWGSDPPDGLTEVPPESEVLAMIDEYGLETPCNVIVFNTDASRRVVIACTAIQVNFDKVYYFEKENLGMNERIEQSADLSNGKSIAKDDGMEPV
ncbi:hypothetical protein INH39_03980 [Massilia violaceinigra]|uniref:Uncharacterized protein n=1 Tax=Massilia violaceinigra TaxID=2045208 RepID=A0ABY4A7Z0_9BURK|nr:hypothetical protein [Massilia violaceinigra]UOD30903.1 hypothetical protein INH39_03980 [Massilia violaceinigra]